MSTTIGWREWVGLPQLGIARIKAKVDTGARSAALHAWHITPFEEAGTSWVAFDLHPMQRRNDVLVQCRAPVIGVRTVRNSGGQAEQRYVIRTEIFLGDAGWPIDVTLTNRDEMGFRLLLGRASIRGRFLVDPGRSFTTLPPRKRKATGDGGQRRAGARKVA